MTDWRGCTRQFELERSLGGRRGCWRCVIKNGWYSYVTDAVFAFGELYKINGYPTVNTADLYIIIAI